MVELVLVTNGSVTNSTKEESYYLGRSWFVYQAVAIVFWLLSLHLVAACIAAAREGCWTTNRSAQSESSGAQGEKSPRRSGNQSNKDTADGEGVADPDNRQRRGAETRKLARKARDGMKSTTDALLTAAAVLTLAYCTLLTVELHIGWYSNDGCKSLFVLTTTAYALGILCVYTVLWCRQRRLYDTPSLKHLSSRPLKAVSLAMLGFTVVGFFGSVTILNLSAVGMSSDRGCLRVGTHLPRWTRVVVLPVLAAIQQVTGYSVLAVRHDFFHVICWDQSPLTSSEIFFAFWDCTGYGAYCIKSIRFAGK